MNREDQLRTKQKCDDFNLLNVNVTLKCSNRQKTPAYEEYIFQYIRYAIAVNQKTTEPRVTRRERQTPPNEKYHIVGTVRKSNKNPKKCRIRGKIDTFNTHT